MFAETLETRCLFAVTAFVSNQGLLEVTGDNNANGIVIDEEDGAISVASVTSNSYKRIFSLPAHLVKQVRIDARGGNDIIEERVEVPVVACGGLGKDTFIPGGFGNFIGFGQSDNPAQIDDNAADTFYIGASDNIMHGQGGNDVFNTRRNNASYTQGRSWFYGGSGNDRFNLESNRPVHAEGGKGDDWFVCVGAGSAEVVGDGGIDTVDFSRSLGEITVSLTPEYASGEEGHLNYRIWDSTENAIGSRTNRNYLFGNYRNNRLVGGLAGDQLVGRGGDDTLFGAEGVDRLEAGAGDDLIYGGKGDDLIEGNVGNDHIYGASGNDKVTGGLGADLIFGGDGDDWLVGEAGNDKIYGGTGDDELYAGAGFDLLVGGAGSDVLYANDGLNEVDALVGDDQSSSALDGEDFAVIDKKNGAALDIVKSCENVVS